MKVLSTMATYVKMFCLPYNGFIAIVTCPVSEWLYSNGVPSHQLLKLVGHIMLTYWFILLMYMGLM